MFVRVTADPAARPNTLGVLGMESSSNPIVNLSEFNYRKGTEIYGEKEPADYVYQVKIGAVRSYKLLSDGRRQIGAFHLAGDIFGLENGSEHRFTAEAIVNTTVRLIKRRSLEMVAESDAMVSRNLLSMTTRQSAACGKPHAPARPQDFAGARRRLPDRDGPTTYRGRRHATADVTARHCRLSGADTGNSVPRTIAAA